MSDYSVAGKRLFDLVIAIPLVFLLSPVMLLVAILVLLRLGRPVLFRQARPGLAGKSFELLKFRTMIDSLDSAGQSLPDEKRLTRVGQFLRSTSLDELPQLFNVIKGDMSLVGPRPLLMKYLDRYNQQQMRRHEVKPGITGWAQVKGRNAISWERRFGLDIWYVDNQSLLLDLRIMILTVCRWLSREGVTQPGHATVEEFMGSD
jgi:sugar transferase EpsL